MGIFFTISDFLCYEFLSYHPVEEKYFVTILILTKAQAKILDIFNLSIIIFNT